MSSGRFNVLDSIAFARACGWLGSQDASMQGACWYIVPPHSSQIRDDSLPHLFSLTIPYRPDMALLSVFSSPYLYLCYRACRSWNLRSPEYIHLN